MAASLSRPLRLRLRGSGHRLLPSRPSSTHASKPPTPPAAAPPPPGTGKEASAWSKLFLFAPGAITFGLGTWQLFRRQEKIEMLDYRTQRLEMEPVAWNETVSSAALRDPSVLEFRKIVCEGDFDVEKSVFIGPRSRSISGVTENGYYVITPLIPRLTEPGSLQLPILVNRGWVPRGWRDTNMQNHQDLGETSEVKQADKKTDERSMWWKFWSKEPESSSEVQKPVKSVKPPVRVIGVIRGSEKPSIFVPANEPSNGQWFYVDVPMIAHECGLPENTVYIEDVNEDVSATNPYPLPKDVNALIHHSVMPDDHLKYTVTWYTLSAAVTYMASKRIKVKKVRL
ncbi:surfeit locus protein 1 [Brachypodium distachyon]|uniref:surfeit locus protein 1 n=1 Tax=Brachypodium distachyon TaxID=15368 RepID=UPI0001C76C6C|nr:surfeit locus protein 1 [Brachypodium distachyon]|eukprot:XP_010229023.1 surfeit locus protein 1 [Brachypodium distachyon]